MDTIERKQRSLDVFSDKEKKLHVLSKFLMNQELSIKVGSKTGDSCILKKVSGDGSKVLVAVRPPGALTAGSQITLYKILGRYLHLECTVEQDKGDNQYILQVNKIAIAKKDRESSRLIVPPGAAWITNVISSKARIETDMFHVPTAVKVNFQDYENKLRTKVDFIKISTFTSDDDDKIQQIKKTKKGLLLSDCLDPNSYKQAPSEDFLVYAEDIDADIQSQINTFRNQKFKSELILPVLYLSEEEESIPIGYIWMMSKTENFDLMKAMEMKTLTFEMVDRIRHSNMIKTDTKFPVLDISEGGLRVKVDHPDLIQSLPKLSGFQFDIFFRMQSPLTAFANIKSITKDEEGHLTVGLSIAGHSNRAGEKKRFLENVEFFRKQLNKG